VPVELPEEKIMLQRVWILSLLLASAAHPQRRVDPKNTYHRIICITPLIGTGTATDPVRPKYAPWPMPVPQNPTNPPIGPAAQNQAGIMAFSYLPSDDGHLAIVEFVARSRSAFQAILSDATVQTFEKGRVSKSAIEAAVQKYRHNFNLDQLGTVMQ
jgi:hypothetical protein